MKYQINLVILTLFHMIFVSSVHANDKIYTMEDIIKNDGYAYDKKSNQPISGIVKIYYDSGVLKKEISLKGGIRHGSSKSYDIEGILYSEMIFEHESLISGYTCDKEGYKMELHKEQIQYFNSTNPKSPEAKEAEVVKKINAALKTVKKQTPDSNLTVEEKSKSWIEFISEGFEKAGYNYFDTINKVADDLKNHRDRIPGTGETRHKLIIMLMALEKSGCQYEKVDCLQYYPPDTRESVQWLWKNTGWSM